MVVRPEIGEFTDREAALAAAEELLAPEGRSRVLIVTGVTGQGKTRLLRRIVELHAGRYRPIQVDLQTLVLGGLGGHDDVRLTAGVDDVVVGLLRALAAGLVSQARWWQRPGRLRRQADQVGEDPLPGRVEQRQVAVFGGRIEDSPQMVQSRTSAVDTIRRGVWVGQVAALARRMRRRRVLLTLDTCEWMYVFDGLPPVPDGTGALRPVAFSPWFAGQLLPALLGAAPRMRIILAGWDDLPVPVATPTIRHRLTGWAPTDTRTFLISAGVTESQVLDTLVELVHPEPDDADLRAAAGLPGLADTLARAVAALPSVPTERAALLRRIHDEPVKLWVPEVILGRLTSRQGREIAAAMVPREITLPVLRALLPDIDPNETDWFTRLISRTLIEPVPTLMGDGESRWRAHALVRRWILDYLTNHDSHAAAGSEVLPNLHRRSVDYYTTLAARNPGRWDLDLAYHSFALGDGTPATAWRTQMLAAAHADRIDIVAAHIEVALAPEHGPTVRDRLPAVTAAALTCAAWLDYRRGRYDRAEVRAIDAADLHEKLDDPTGRVGAWRLAGQAAWSNWHWADAAAHWQHAIDAMGPTTLPDDRLALLVALVEVTLGCGDLPAAQAHAAHAQEFLNSQPPSPATEPDVPAVAPALPPEVPLATAVPAARMSAWLALLAADAALRAGHHDQAASVLDDADPLVTDPSDGAELLRLRAEHALADDQAPQAAALADEAADAVSAAGDPPALRLAVLRTQAVAALRMANYGRSVPGDSTVRRISLGDVFAARRYRQLARQHIDAALELATNIGHSHARAGALAMNGSHDQALALFRAIGDRRGQANSHRRLADLAQLRADHDTAASHCVAALDLFREAGDRNGQADALTGLGDIARGRSHYDAAASHYTEALTLFEQVGNRNGQAVALSGLAETAHAKGENDVAVKGYTSALALFEEIGHRFGQALALRGLGGIARLLGQYDIAASHYTDAIVRYEQLGGRNGEVGVVALLGDALIGLGHTVYMSGGEHETATSHYTDAFTLYKNLGDLRGQANVLRGLGGIAHAHGDYETATSHFSAALALYLRFGDPRGQAEALVALGETARARDDIDNTRFYLTQAAGIYDALGLTQRANKILLEIPAE